MKEAQLVQQHQLYPGSQMRKRLDQTALTPSNNDEQMILQLLAEHKNLFKHFHKKWATV